MVFCTRGILFQINLFLDLILVGFVFPNTVANVLQMDVKQANKFDIDMVAKAINMPISVLNKGAVVI